MNHFDFCILDIMLPSMDGFTLLEKIKECNKKVPVMLLSARSLKDDKIKGFSLGIDDYLTKPFDEEELLYRIKVMLNVWGESDYYTGRSLDVFISKLRSYLKEDVSIRITTIPTVGYILEVL